MAVHYGKAIQLLGEARAVAGGIGSGRLVVGSHACDQVQALIADGCGVIQGKSNRVLRGARQAGAGAGDRETGRGRQVVIQLGIYECITDAVTEVIGKVALKFKFDTTGRCLFAIGDGEEAPAGRCIHLHIIPVHHKGGQGVARIAQIPLDTELHIQHGVGIVFQPGIAFGKGTGQRHRIGAAATITFG